MSSCKSCPAGCKPTDQPQLVTLGDSSGRNDYVIALAGNPNTGKSTLFNFLTGLRQHTGNWAGKTVSRAEGLITHAGKRFRLVDLPGTYSLQADSVDEQIARDFILFSQPDCTIVVCDATVLERNLLLALQIRQITDRVVLCVNLIDEARRKRIEIEADVLERELGAPVVATVARHGKGLSQLMDRVHEMAAGRSSPSLVDVAFDADLERAISEIADNLRAALPDLACARWIAMRLLEGDERVEAALRDGSLARLAAGGGAGVS